MAKRILTATQQAQMTKRGKTKKGKKNKYGNTGRGRKN
jgi:hypothetical protein